MDLKKLLFIYNPNAGRGLIGMHLTAILNEFVRAGYEVTVYPTQSRGDALARIPHLAGRFDRIVCCGGDGTLDEVVAGVLQSGCSLPLGYLPAGTTNDFSQSLAIPSDLEEAAAIAAGGRLFDCDVGTFNGESYIYIAAFGVFTEVSYQTDQRLKSVLGHAAYLISTPKSLIGMPSYEMEVEANGEIFRGKFVYGMVTNAVSVGGLKNLTGTSVALDDGRFEVTLVMTPQNPLMLGDIVTNLLMPKDSESPYIYAFKTDHIVFRCDEAIPWTLDGEFGGEHREVEICNLNRRITFVVPEKEEKDDNGPGTDLLVR